MRWASSAALTWAEMAPTLATTAASRASVRPSCARSWAAAATCALTCWGVSASSAPGCGSGAGGADGVDVGDPLGEALGEVVGVGVLAGREAAALGDVVGLGGRFVVGEGLVVGELVAVADADGVGDVVAVGVVAADVVVAGGVVADVVAAGGVAVAAFAGPAPTTAPASVETLTAPASTQRATPRRVEVTCRCRPVRWWCELPPWCRRAVAEPTVQGGPSRRSGFLPTSAPTADVSRAGTRLPRVIVRLADAPVGPTMGNMHLVKRFAVTIVGAVLLVVGVAMMILPGPGILLIVAGLAVLATEYVWARRLLVRAKKQAQQVQDAAVASTGRTAASLAFALGLAALGLGMLLIEDVAWPALDDLIAKVWSPITGGIMIVTGLILLTTTILTVRLAKGHETTHADPASTGGSTAYNPAR